MCDVPPLERWLHWKLTTGPSSATHYQLMGEFETLAKEVIAWCESKQLDDVPRFPTLATEIRKFSARPEFSNRVRLVVGGGRRSAGAPLKGGWRINKLEIKETWTRYGFYEENNPETFYYETDDESGGVITIRLP